MKKSDYYVVRPYTGPSATEGESDAPAGASGRKKTVWKILMTVALAAVLSSIVAPIVLFFANEDFLWSDGMPRLRVRGWMIVIIVFAVYYVLSGAIITHVKEQWAQWSQSRQDAPAVTPRQGGDMSALMIIVSYLSLLPMAFLGGLALTNSFCGATIVTVILLVLVPAIILGLALALKRFFDMKYP